MKISFLIPSLAAAGAERQTVAMANGLAAKGHSVSVILFRAEGALRTNLAPTVRLHDLGKGGKADVARFLFKAASHFRSERPDILYTLLGSPNIIGATIKAVLPDTALIWSVRASGMDLSRYPWAYKLAHRLENMLSWVPARTIANSNAGKAHALGRGFPADSLEVVPNGIDTDRFIPDRSLGEHMRAKWDNGGENLVGVVARLDPKKGHVPLLHAMRKAYDGGAGMKLICIGTGPMEAELRDLSKRLGLEDRVLWEGVLNNMPEVYNALDVCCLPSIFGEGFPNVVGEAMSCGVPCVVTDVGDSALVVGDTGLVVQPDDADGLARALLNTDGIREKHGSAARQRIKDNFSIQTMIDRTERIMKELAWGA